MDLYFSDHFKAKEADLEKYGTFNISLVADLPANAKIKFQKDDVIVSKVRPYRGAIGIVDSENYVGSGALTVLQENGVVNKETLLDFF